MSFQKLRSCRPQLIPNVTPIGVPTQLFPAVSGGTINTNSAAFTPTANGLKCLPVFSKSSGFVTVADINVTDSLGQTWSKVFDQTVTNAGAPPCLRIALWVHRTSGSPVSMTVHVQAVASIDHSGAYGFELPTNVADDFSRIYFGNTSGDGDPVCTMGVAPDYRSCTIGMAGSNGGGSFVLGSIPSGFTSLANFVGGTTIQANVCYRMGNVATNLPWTTSNTQASLAVGFEARQD